MQFTDFLHRLFITHALQFHGVDSFLTICSVGSRKYTSITVTQISGNLCTDLQRIIVFISDDSVKKHNFQIWYSIQ